VGRLRAGGGLTGGSLEDQTDPQGRSAFVQWTLARWDVDIPEWNNSSIAQQGGQAGALDGLLQRHGDPEQAVGPVVLVSHTCGEAVARAE
jgi:hypothetical protein